VDYKGYFGIIDENNELGVVANKPEVLNGYLFYFGDYSGLVSSTFYFPS